MQNQLQRSEQELAGKTISQKPTKVKILLILNDNKLNQQQHQISLHI